MHQSTMATIVPMAEDSVDAVLLTSAWREWRMA
jgi:hypothetical protein